MKESVFSSPFRPQVLETIFRMSKPNGVTPSPFWAFQPLREIPGVFTVFFVDHFSAPGTCFARKHRGVQGFRFGKIPWGDRHKTAVVFSAQEPAGNDRRTKMAHILQGSTSIRKCEQSNMLT